MANPTVFLINSQTLSSSVSSVSFTSIPQTYTDLKIVYSARDDQASTQDNVRMTFNGATSSYAQMAMYGYSGTAYGTSNTPAYLDYQYTTGNSAVGNTFSNTEIYIPNYATANNKTLSIESVSENNASSGVIILTAGSWATTAAITTVTFVPVAGNFVANSTFYLYGIKNS